MEQLSQESSNAFLVSTFHIGETLWGIDTLKVQEVIRVVDVTCVHHAPDYIVGIINLRGKIVTIIDLSKKLHLPKLETTEKSRIIIVKWNMEYVGFLVDSISDIVNTEKDKIQPPPSNINGAQGKYFKGIYHTEDQLIAILKVEKVLSE